MMESRVRRLLTKLAMGSVPYYADWGLRKGDFERTIGREANLAWLVPLALCFLGLINRLLLLIIPPLTYFMLKIMALRAASKALNRKITAEKYSPLIICELKLAYHATGSMERAFLFVAEGNYPEVSSSLRRLLKRAEEGKDLIKELLKYAETKAPPSLREFLIKFVKRPEDTALPPGLYSKLWEAYLEDVKKLRLNTLLFFGLSFLLPVPTVLILLLMGQAGYLSIITSVYVLILALAARTLMLKSSGPMGG
ncbi:MAG: hypothetical protein N3H31_02720 [Candidatus Nezhaarchaeota archaeon]|nr:hypothetical protein [Candidatus Nezhaarchaeota archaeon]